MSVEIDHLKGTLLGERKRIAEELEEIAKIIIEAFRPAVEACKDQCGTFIEHFRLFYVVLQRTQLVMVLMQRWHIPCTLASWLAWNWPKRWLPKLKPQLWERDEKETVT